MIVIGEMLSSSFKGVRTKHHIQQNDDSHVYLSFNIGNTIQISRQFGREAEAPPGEALLGVWKPGSRRSRPRTAVASASRYGPRISPNGDWRRPTSPAGGSTARARTIGC